MKKLALISLPLVLAACGGLGTPGEPSVKVSASTLLVNLSSATNAATTTYTFTNRAGGRETAIDTATLTWTEKGTDTKKSATVSIPSFKLPAGLTCPAATTPNATCNGSDPATNFGERSVTQAISNAELFRKVLTDNPSVTDLPVEVQFNNTANALGFTFTSTPSTPGGSETGGPTKPIAKLPSPVLTVNTAGNGPFSGALSVTVSGNFDAVSTVDKVILEVTDPSGNVDNTTYVSAAASATFSLDTSKYKDGELKLRAIALTKENLRGETSPRTIQVSNISAPTFEILSPDAGATITGPTTVRMQLRQGNTPFTLQALKGSDDVRLDVRDFRGQIVKTAYGKASKVSEGVLEAFILLDLIGPDFSNNTYSLEATAQALLSGSPVRTIGATRSVSAQVKDSLPPALIVLMPAYIIDPYTNQNVRGILSRSSAVVVQVSDDQNVASIRLDFACDEATKTPEQVCPRAPFSYNLLVNKAGPLKRLFDVGALLDGQPYVQNGNYTLRVTASDGNNSNIQEFPIRVSRTQSDSTIAGLEARAGVSVVPDNVPEQLNPSSATWFVPGTPTNPYRLTVLAYDGADNQAPENPTRSQVFPDNAAGTPISLTQSFSEEGTFRTDFVVQDLLTGVTRYYQGTPIIVKRNQKQD